MAIARSSCSSDSERPSRVDQKPPSTERAVAKRYPRTSLAISATRDAAGSSTTWPGTASSGTGSGGLGSEVTSGPSEQVAAHEVRGVAALHVRTRVHHHVPVPAGGRIFRLDRGASVGRSGAVRHHLVQREQDSAWLLAAARVHVRDVR